jgi:hypothetical protein
VTHEDRHFFGLLAMILGPLTILAGWLTVATYYGPALMVVGALQLAAAPVLRPTMRTLAIAPVLFGLGFGWHDLVGAL